MDARFPSDHCCSTAQPRHMIFWPTVEFNVIRLCLRTFPLEENIPRVAAATRGCGPALSSRAEAVRASTSAFPRLLLTTSTTPVGEGLSRPTLSSTQATCSLSSSSEPLPEVAAAEAVTNFDERSKRVSASPSDFLDIFCERDIPR